MLPGSMRTIVLPAMVAAAGEPAGRRYEVVYHPEFIREGTAVADYSFPARIVVGERQPGSAGVLLDLFPGADVPTFMTSFEVAELTKFADNGFHALKVAFANEIGRFALCSGIPPADVFDIFRADTRLNLSASYLRPGGAFGGPCLPKDVRALAARMNEVGIAAPVIDHILASNASHTDFLIAEIERRAAPGSRILLVGLSFKAGTDDLRGSPLVRLAELLLDRGHDLAILDPDLPSDAAVGVQAQLSSRLAAKVLSGPPASTGWDLVVVGKHCPDILRSVDAKIFRIDQL
jgi:GDP-mannose 6-dehydrogenase